MGKEKRLKHRVRSATDPDLEKNIKPEPQPAQPEPKPDIEPEPKPKPADPETEKEPEPEAQRHNLRQLDPELSKKFAGRLDRLLCVLATAALKRSRPKFELQVEEISAIEFGESIVDLVNFYLPQMDTSSPWPPFVMAAIGVGAVIGSKLSETPKAKTPPKIPAKAIAQALQPPAQPQQPPQPPQQPQQPPQLPPPAPLTAPQPPQTPPGAQ